MAAAPLRIDIDPRMDLIDELESHILPGDGAVGTLLPDADAFPEAFCLTEPDLVASIHQQYIAAGARVLTTNSFGANAVRMEEHGLDHRVNELNWTAARLARDAAKAKPVYVAGCVGPLGVSSESGLDRAAVYQEQIGALLDGGANLIFFSSFPDVEELALALEIKESLHHCPAIASLACPPEERLPSGMLLGDAFSRLFDLGAAIVGIACHSWEPCDLPQLLQRVSAGGPLSAYPNAARLAQTTSALVTAGARLIGGGAGTRPEHIAALAEAVRYLKPLSDKPLSHYQSLLIPRAPDN